MWPASPVCTRSSHATLQTSLACPNVGSTPNGGSTVRLSAARLRARGHAARHAVAWSCDGVISGEDTVADTLPAMQALSGASKRVEHGSCTRTTAVATTASATSDSAAAAADQLSKYVGP